MSAFIVVASLTTRVPAIAVLPEDAVTLNLSVFTSTLPVTARMPSIVILPVVDPAVIFAVPLPFFIMKFLEAP